MDVFVEATGDDYIFSDQGDPVALTAGENITYSGAFYESSSGNDYGDGGFASGSGYYVGWDGESTIAIHTTDIIGLSIFGGDANNCVISGILQLIKK